MDANQRISADYNLSDLCVTNQTLNAPNLPTDQSHIDNLGVLASVLEYITSAIGPFKILSGYRTQELEAKLTAQGEPTAKGLSFHELGRAVDIYPLTMTLDEFFGQLIADEYIREMFSEIAYKPSQNSIHLAVNTPDDTRTPKILGLNTDKVYSQLSLEDIQNFIAPYVKSVTEAFDSAVSIVAAQNKTPIYLALAGITGLVIYFSMGKTRKSTA